VVATPVIVASTVDSREEYRTLEASRTPSWSSRYRRDDCGAIAATDDSSDSTADSGFLIGELAIRHDSLARVPLW
jgi:hypothetical protein